MSELILDKLYPIGSIYLETTNTNPSSKLGGTWVAYGASDTYLRLGGNGSGGSNSVKLSANQIPSLTTGNESAGHTHSTGDSGNSLLSNKVWSTGSYADLQTGGGEGWYAQSTSINTGGVSNNHTHTYTNNNQQTVSITPKYVQVYAWKRTA